MNSQNYRDEYVAEDTEVTTTETVEDMAVENKTANDGQADTDDTKQLEKDDLTVARRLREISAKKNEWKQRAEEYRQKYEDLRSRYEKQPQQKPSSDDDMEKVFAEDVMAIRQAFPHVKVKDVRELNNLQTFARLRDAGFDAVEAYRASNVQEIIAQAMHNDKSSRSDNRAHLVSIGATTVRSDMENIPNDVLGIWRSAFPKLNDRELTALYNKNK